MGSSGPYVTALKASRFLVSCGADRVAESTLKSWPVDKEGATLCLSDVVKVAVEKGVLAAPSDDLARRREELQVRRLELQVAKEEGTLIDVDAAHQDVARVFASLRAHLASVPACITDPVLRRTVESRLRNAVEHAAQQTEFEK